MSHIIGSFNLRDFNFANKSSDGTEEEIKRDCEKIAKIIIEIIDYHDSYILEQEYEAILNNLNLKQIPKDEACQTPDGKIRLDEYALNNAICYPLRLSLFNENGNKVGEIECKTNKDFSRYEKCSATDVWLYHKDTWGGLEIMKLQLEFAMNMSGEASGYATAVAKKLDFESDIKKKGVVRVTPTKGVGCVVATQGDYYMISLEVVSKPRLLAIWFGIVAVLWTMWIVARVWIRWSRL